MLIKTNSLSKEILRIIQEKSTEPPYAGKYNEFNGPGSYLCRQCGTALFRSQTKFNSSCGWPSFDEEIKNAIECKLDADGLRKEIVCKYCLAHLGHIFQGEYLTPKNIRYCVNSLSLDYVENEEIIYTEEAIVAAGCFWGVEFLFNQLPGVLKTEVGYTGGQLLQPTYEQICTGTTGHLEALRIVYDPKKINYEAVIKYFFEIHDFTQKNGQGPDRGKQYLSAIFYYDVNQKKIAQYLIQILQHLNYSVVTKIFPVTVFWSAEVPHQDYYKKNGGKPYCHFYTKRF